MTKNSNKGSKTKQINGSKSSSTPQEQGCYEGEKLDIMLKLVQGGIVSARIKDGDSLPEKIWLKQQFAVGVNDVTRVLERMRPCVIDNDTAEGSPRNGNELCSNRKASPVVPLQAILLAADCNPRVLTKHLHSLASSRNVPLILVKDLKMGSLRLGKLVKLKTTIAIGVKAKGNAINEVMENVICGKEVEFET